MKAPGTADGGVPVRDGFFPGEGGWLLPHGETRKGPMLRGNCPAKIDAKGRLKIPTAFRRHFEDQYGREFFVTSITGEFARIYPMPIWVEIEKKLAAAPSMSPAIQRYTNVVSYFGQMATSDEQGRILIHPLLRQSSGINGAVAVLGKQTFVDVWSQETFLSLLKQQPLSDEDKNILASLGL